GQLQRQWLAQQLLQIQIEVVREQFDFELEQLRQALIPSHLPECQAVHRRMDNNGTRLQDARYIHKRSPETISGHRHDTWLCRYAVFIRMSCKPHTMAR